MRTGTQLINRRRTSAISGGGAIGLGALLAVLGFPLAAGGQDFPGNEEFDYEYQQNQDWENDDWGDSDWVADDYRTSRYENRQDRAFEFNDPYSYQYRNYEQTRPRAEFGYADDWDYGWHYDASANEWDYGWHYNNEPDTARRTTRFDFSRNYDRSADTSSGQFRLTGDIEHLYTQWKGNQEHLMARVETDDGRTLVVDFGPRDFLEPLKLTEGSHVTVLANRDTFRGSGIIVADRVMSGGETIAVGHARFAPGEPGMRQIRGEIEDLYTRNLRGETHLVARIDADAGRKFTAVLGPHRQLRTLHIEEGDDVIVFGRTANVEGQQMFVAQRIRTDDDRVVRVAGTFGTPGFSGDFAGENRRFAGDIVDLSYKTHRDHTHVIAAIQTDQGDMFEADLGARQNLEWFNLHEGDRIVLFGDFGTLGNRTMFKAARLQAGGRTLNIAREGAFFDASFQREVKPVSGKILSTHTEAMPGYRNEQLVAHIQCDDGGTEMVVLGPANQLRNLNLRSGEKVTLLAAYKADQPYMQAKQIRAQGRVITVRSGM